MKQAQALNLEAKHRESQPYKACTGPNRNKVCTGGPNMKQAQVLNLQASTGTNHTVCIHVLNAKHARAPNVKYALATIKRGGSQV